jgi:hypothetical protein
LQRVGARAMSSAFYVYTVLIPCSLYQTGVTYGLAWQRGETVIPKVQVI